MARIIGDGKDNDLGAFSAGDVVFGQAGNDILMGADGGVALNGGGRDDKITGGSGDDLIHGGGGMPLGFSDFKVAESLSAHVTVSGTDTDSLADVVGMYSYDKAGNITSVKLVGETNSPDFDVAIAKGERLGFFFVPDGLEKGSDAFEALMKGGQFKLVNASGEAGNVLDGKPLTLVSVDAEGNAAEVPFAPGSQMFNSIKSLNADGKSHVTTEVDPSTGQVKLVFTDAGAGNSVQAGSDKNKNSGDDNSVTEQ